MTLRPKQPTLNHQSRTKRPHVGNTLETTSDTEIKSSHDPKTDTPYNESGESIYNSNLFVVKSSLNAPKPKLRHRHNNNNNEFSVQVIINNSLDKVLADTGAKVSVCGTVQAANWGILDKLVPSQIKIQPYKSAPIRLCMEQLVVQYHLVTP